MDDSIRPATLVDAFKTPEDIEAFRDWVLEVLATLERERERQADEIQLLKDLVYGED